MAGYCWILGPKRHVLLVPPRQLDCVQLSCRQEFFLVDSIILFQGIVECKCGCLVTQNTDDEVVELRLFFDFDLKLLIQKQSVPKQEAGSNSIARARNEELFDVGRALLARSHLCLS